MAFSERTSTPSLAESKAVTPGFVSAVPQKAAHVLMQADQRIRGWK